LTDVFGVSVEEVEPIFAGNQNQVHLTLKDTETDSGDGMWCDLLGGTAEALGTYTSDYKKGAMIVSKNSFGKGKACYLGTDLGERAMGELLAGLCREAGMAPSPVRAEKNVEVVHRVLDGHDYYYIFNFTAGDTVVKTEVPVYDYLKGCVYENDIPMERNGFVLVKRWRQR
ncbi:beta-galactosidase trimerization domain-containing protein, partial [Blautia pseudococcoides]|nr:beta-galactosidase trimerization domain-containing protein [Blautia pseudococcoides]